MRQLTAKSIVLEFHVGVTHFIHIISYVKKDMEAINKENIKNKLFINDFPHMLFVLLKSLLNYFIFIYRDKNIFL